MLANILEALGLLALAAGLIAFFISLKYDFWLSPHDKDEYHDWTSDAVEVLMGTPLPEEEPARRMELQRRVRVAGVLLNRQEREWLHRLYNEKKHVKVSPLPTKPKKG